MTVTDYPIPHNTTVSNTTACNPTRDLFPPHSFPPPIPQDDSSKSNPSPVLTLIAEKIGERRFELWFEQVIRCESCPDSVTFYVRNGFAVNSIRRHCQKEIDQAVREIYNNNPPVNFVVQVPAESEKRKHHTPFLLPPDTDNDNALLDKRTLGIVGEKIHKERGGRKFASMTTFLEGMSNSLACRAADLAINHPGQINPIYIFGSSSTGKTHLLEGIWSETKKLSSPRAYRQLPMYMTAESFISSFVEVVRNGSVQNRNQSFRNKFKGISHLLLDDIHFFARAEASQTELLQVFDLLRNQGIQLVFTGDRPLKDLPLRKELLCRLESGMVCEIELPERELALKICKEMCKQRKLSLNEDVCRMVSSRFGANARQISGALNRLYAVYWTKKEPITLATAEETLSDLLRLNRRDIRLADIGKIVSDTFGLSEETLRSKSRLKQIVTPRMLAMWLARKYTRSALSEIGLYFGNRSHSTVLSAQKKIDKFIHEDSVVAEAVQRIELTFANMN